MSINQIIKILPAFVVGLISIGIIIMTTRMETGFDKVDLVISGLILFVLSLVMFNLIKLEYKIISLMENK